MPVCFQLGRRYTLIYTMQDLPWKHSWKLSWVLTSGLSQRRIRHVGAKLESQGKAPPHHWCVLGETITIFKTAWFFGIHSMQSISIHTQHRVKLICSPDRGTRMIITCWLLWIAGIKKMEDLPIPVGLMRKTEVRELGESMSSSACPYSRQVKPALGSFRNLWRRASILGWGVGRLLIGSCD